MLYLYHRKGIRNRHRQGRTGRKPHDEPRTNYTMRYIGASRVEDENMNNWDIMILTNNNKLARFRDVSEDIALSVFVEHMVKMPNIVIAQVSRGESVIIDIHGSNNRVYHILCDDEWIEVDEAIAIDWAKKQIRHPETLIKLEG